MGTGEEAKPREGTETSRVLPGAAVRRSIKAKTEGNQEKKFVFTQCLQSYRAFLSKFTFLGVVLIVGVICLLFQLLR